MEAEATRERRRATTGRKATWLVTAGAMLTFLAGAAAFLSVGDEPAPGPAIPDLTDEIAAVTRVAGGPPERCFVAAPGRQVCRWHVEGRLLSGKSPTRPGGESGLYLVCELRRGEAEDTYREIFGVRPEFSLDREIPRLRMLYTLTISNPETQRFFGNIRPGS